MKKKINVIDLDKTLIPYDTFRLLIKKEISSFNLHTILISFLRVVRLISPEQFKRKITFNIQKKRNSLYFEKFASAIYKDINSKVMEEIVRETDKNTINILVSASPNLYVQFLIEKMNWKGSGSYFDASGNFIHLYGNNKVLWVKKCYDTTEFKYNMSISDSASDDNLLNLFDKKIKWTLQ